MKKLKNKINRVVRNYKGSVMAEVIISIFVFTMGLTASATMLFTTIKSNAINTKRILALNLAREGIEAIRNMRDTNWLVYNYNRRDCWNFWDDTNEDGFVNSSDDDCQSDGYGQNQHPLGELGVTEYIANLNTSNFRWALIRTDNTLITGGNLSIELYKNAAGIHVHNPNGNDPTGFSRIIRITYPNNSSNNYLFPDNTSTTPTDEIEINRRSDNHILVESIVTWGDHEVSLAQTLTDYLYRTDWDE